MNKVTCILFTVICLTAAHDALKGTELEFTYLVHRHGDRTPTASSVAYSTDPETLIELTAPIGYGQLTERGKLRGYQLGQFIRSRYNGLIAPKYNSSEVYIRSTDSTRSKMTILAALAAIYPAGRDSWSQKIKWTPVPYTTVPMKYDPNIFSSNCPVYMDYINAAFLSAAPSMARFSTLLQEVSNIISIDITDMPVVVYLVYDLYVSQLGLGMPLPPEMEPIFPEIAQAAAAGIDIILGNEEYVSLIAGVMLNDFISYTAKIRAGEATPRVRILSAHDINVYAWLVASQLQFKLGVPKYGSAFALELRRVKATGQYVVVPVYLPSPGEEVVYIPFEGCGILCDYDQFVNITSKNALDEDTWRKKCGFTNDLVVDDSSYN